MAKKDALGSPPRGQKSLTSFFGAARSRKTGEAIPPRKVQGGIAGALRRQQAAAAEKKKAEETKKRREDVDDDAAGKEEANNDAAAGKKEKENVENGEEKRTTTAAKKRGEDGRDEGDAQKATAKEAPAEEDLMDTDDEEDAAKGPAAEEPAKEAKEPSPSRKRVIDDDDSSEEEAYEEEEGEEEEEDEEMEEGDYEEEEASDDDDDAEPSEDGSPEKSKTSSGGAKDDGDSPPPKSKKQKTLTGKTAPAKSVKSASSGAGSKSEAAARAMKSNSQLAKIMEEEEVTWERGAPTPYAALCDAFGEIEAISGRLEIQERLTTLFRKVLLRDGGGDAGEEDDADDDDAEGEGKGGTETDAKRTANGGASRRSDLYTLLYLASNSVAPQHANVELGVGDSILIKAIGEASGIAPAMVKRRYGKEGDLGDVAMSAKGKQRTLVGFGR